MARRDSRNRVDLSKGGKRDLLKWPQSYRVIAFSTLIESSQCSQAFAGSRLRGTYELIAQGNCCAWYFLGRHPLGDKFVPLRLPFVPPRALAGLLHAVLARARDSAARFAQCEACALPRIAGSSLARRCQFHICSTATRARRRRQNEALNPPLRGRRGPRADADEAHQGDEAGGAPVPARRRRDGVRACVKSNCTALFRWRRAVSESSDTRLTG